MQREEKQVMGMWHNDYLTLLFWWQEKQTIFKISMQIEAKKSKFTTTKVRFRKRTFIKESSWKSEFVGTHRKLLWKMRIYEERGKTKERKNGWMIKIRKKWDFDI